MAMLQQGYFSSREVAGRDAVYIRNQVFVELTVQVFYPAALLLLLTRPSVKQLFKHGSEADPLPPGLR